MKILEKEREKERGNEKESVFLRKGIRRERDGGGVRDKWKKK